MDIKNLSVTEIKALLYDLHIEQKRIAHNIQVLEKEIAQREKEKKDEK
tara:strand:+ start:550 stop:693 length:144 start_codon:yes stop_codon:yes gene_type:complete